MKLSNDYLPGSLPLPAIRQIGHSAPLRWLAAAWQDMRANPLPSLAYGLLFALGGDLILLSALSHPHLVSVAISGFFLVAPLLAAGLYELSRARSRGERLLFIDSLRVFRAHGESMALFGLILALICLFWERFTAVAFSLFGQAGTQVYLPALILSGDHGPLLLTWLLLGAVVAASVFAASVVAVPLMLDRDADLATALMTSLRATAANPGPLLGWAVAIVALTLFGFATLLFGLIVIMPLLGHASWHAYRELVE